MFKGKLELQGIKDLLSKTVSFALDENHLFETLHIPVIKENNVCLYNKKTLQMTQHALSLTPQVDKGTAYCCTTENTVFCCGGCNSSDVYEVNAQSGAVERPPGMHQNKDYAGIFNLSGKCVLLFGGVNKHYEKGYVFGGWIKNYLKTVEKYDLERKAWTELPSMEVEKYSCSVCQHSSGLYISGFSDTTRETTIELFNPISETCRLLHTEVGFSGILCCVQDELYHIRSSLIEVGSLTTGQTSIAFTQKGTVPKEGSGAYWLCCPASVVEGKVVGMFVANGTRCGLFRFESETVQFSQVVSFNY